MTTPIPTTGFRAIVHAYDGTRAAIVAEGVRYDGHLSWRGDSVTITMDDRSTAWIRTDAISAIVSLPVGDLSWANRVAASPSS